jgi:VWFA-related protein
MNAVFPLRIFLILVLVPSTLTLAQQSESPNLPPAAADAGHITLNVVVADKSDKPVTGLQEPDFAVFDNNAPQKLLSFQAFDTAAPPPPTEVILLVDAVNARFTTVSYERDQIQKFLRQNGGKLAQPTSIILFEDTKTQILPTPTRDGNALLSIFDKNVTGLRDLRRSSGIYGAEERLDLSLKALGQLAAYESNKPGRKLVVWISPGWPLLSGPNVELSNNQQRLIFNSVVMMAKALQQARITLYSVDPLGTADAGSIRLFYYQEFLKGVTEPRKVSAGNLALQVLAIHSGGRALSARNDITAQINRCVADSLAYYELVFDAARAERPNEYHNVDVKVARPHLTVNSTAGYYAQPQP